MATKQNTGDSRGLGAGTGVNGKPLAGHSTVANAGVSGPTDQPAYTPGPWHIAEAVESKTQTSMRRIRSANEKTNYSGAVCEVYGIRDGTEAAANARLIAAAPELVEALRDVLKWFDDEPPLDTFGAKAFAKARTLLARVEAK